MTSDVSKTSAVIFFLSKFNFIDAAVCSYSALVRRGFPLPHRPSYLSKYIIKTICMFPRHSEQIFDPALAYMQESTQVLQKQTSPRGTITRTANSSLQTMQETASSLAVVLSALWYSLKETRAPTLGGMACNASCRKMWRLRKCLHFPNRPLRCLNSLHLLKETFLHDGFQQRDSVCSLPFDSNLFRAFHLPCLPPDV